MHGLSGTAAVAAAGSLGIIAHSDVETISALGAISAVIPELQSIFKAKGRSKAYGEGHDLIRQAIARYHQKNKRNGTVPTNELTAEGSNLMSEVAASIKAVDTALQQSIPSIEDMKAATGELSKELEKLEKLDTIKIIPKSLSISQGSTGKISIIKDDAINAVPLNSGIVFIDPSQFGQHGTDTVTVFGVKKGSTKIKLFNDRGNKATTTVTVEGIPLKAIIVPKLNNITITNKIIKKDNVVTLDGSTSEEAKVFEWIITPPTGSSVSLTKTDSAVTTFKATDPGTYLVGLTIYHSSSKKVSHTTTLTIRTNTPPTAILVVGPNQELIVGNPIILDGSTSTDAENDKRSFRWNIDRKPLRSNPTLNNDHKEKSIFTADASGKYVLRNQAEITSLISNIC